MLLGLGNQSCADQNSCLAATSSDSNIVWGRSRRSSSTEIPLSRAQFTMRDGKVVDYTGDKTHILQDYVASFNEENLSKISHMMIGMCPGVRELSYQIVEDERIWGGSTLLWTHLADGHATPRATSQLSL